MFKWTQIFAFTGLFSALSLNMILAQTDSMSFEGNLLPEQQQSVQISPRSSIESNQPMNYSIQGQMRPSQNPQSPTAESYNPSKILPPEAYELLPPGYTGTRVQRENLARQLWEREQGIRARRQYREQLNAPATQGQQQQQRQTEEPYLNPYNFRR